ncbi:hypothetical protein Rhopal_000369-T1 [Rhodotorula paludigena]|uniref:Uncharacterized protein n=1 Tax=Rhodotorula paludigena TaxID=86838 RepID=A0AAV5GCN8_9BASI|nr:hypothetical protein Rhopal_000369-T1 [Rhodotorula paludigena]
MPRSSSPDQPDLASDDALARLAQLEALVAGSLFAPEPATTATTPAEARAEPPKKRKKTKHAVEPTPVKPDHEPKSEEAVAFRLFSSQKTPAKVVLREADSPPPVVLDRRIRDVDDESKEAVDARQEAIAAIAVDGETVPHPPSFRLSHRILSTSVRSPFSLSPSSPASAPLPRLAYLNAHLPAPFHALSPHDVPFPEALEAQGLQPPKEPHEALLARAPFEGVYAKPIRRPRRLPTGEEGELEPVKGTEIRMKDGRRHELPARNPLLRIGNEGKCRLVVKAVLKEEQSDAVAAARKAAKAEMGRKGKRRSKARRERERRRAGGAAPPAL